MQETASKVLCHRLPMSWTSTTPSPALQKYARYPSSSILPGSDGQRIRGAGCHGDTRGPSFCRAQRKKRAYMKEEQTGIRQPTATKASRPCSCRQAKPDKLSTGPYLCPSQCRGCRFETAAAHCSTRLVPACTTAADQWQTPGLPRPSPNQPKPARRMKSHDTIPLAENETQLQRMLSILIMAGDLMHATKYCLLCAHLPEALCAAWSGR